jgi:hypothetical protein
VYLRSWRSHRARLNEFTEALSSGLLPMLRLFENYGSQFANFKYEFDEVCFKGSNDEILELFAFLDCKVISASLEKHLEQHQDDPHAIIVNLGSGNGLSCHLSLAPSDSLYCAFVARRAGPSGHTWPHTHHIRL